LLGGWRSDWKISNDTMDLVSFAAIGNSIGKVAITIDTANVAHTQLASKFTIAISAIPAPINLDTISFTLDYDADLAELQPPVGTINNYLLTPTAVSYGKIQYQLTRLDRNSPTTLAFGSSSFDVPFSCNVARNDTSLLLLENIFLSQQSTAAYSPGMITVASQCGDQTLRDYLNGHLPVLAKSVVPNPARTGITITFLSQEKTDIEVSLVNTLGEISLRKTISIEQGSQQQSLDLSAIASGNYQLIFSRNNATISVQNLSVVR
jgi:hypothetical protein